ncbi:AraC family transcriptional regulator [Vallicoccus soli]|uniref:AraC family transcriptional regulator n=1 Tax=Vallicoccus soli TaxID=2339232 RepID=UPI001C49BD11|nr:helix-turn-helix domain-containing protein [Vallicoccus soli]
MAYRERTLPGGAVLWRSDAPPAPVTRRILPDGCLDVLHLDGRWVVAGPDTAARLHTSGAGAAHAGLRLPGGRGPALLGVPAHALRDRTVDLAAVLGDRAAADLAGAGADPAGALAAWWARRLPRLDVDPLGPRLLALAERGAPVPVAAAATGWSERQLRRRAHELFGYGPRHLARVLRLGRALDLARAGLPLAEVAARTGHADQQHLSREVRALTGTTPTGLLAEEAARAAQPSGANRSTEAPPGPSTTA